MSEERKKIEDLANWRVVFPNHLYRYYINGWMYELTTHHHKDETYCSLDVLPYPSQYSRERLAVYIPIREALEKAQRDIFVRVKYGENKND